jgi:hypothetical protein
MADGHKLAFEVYQALSQQLIKCNIVPLTRPKGKDICLAQVDNMNLLKRFASDPYTIFMDDDVVLSGPTDLFDMECFLDENPEYDAVAYDTKYTNIENSTKLKHVICAIFMIRKSTLDNYTFASKDGQCQCMDVNEKLKIRYLDDRRLTEIK